MDSYSEVRRVRHEMSQAVGHDIRKLAATYNARRAEVAHRIIDPGTKAEKCGFPLVTGESPSAETPSRTS